MTCKKTFYQYHKHYYFIICLFLFNSALGQTLKQEKMEQLSFMIGEWVGTSKLYTNEIVSQEVPAYQKITYSLDKSIIIIQLKSETLQLHTVIYYDDKEKTYYYNPFSKKGARKLPAEYKNGQFIVSSPNNKRFIFSKTSEGGFQEYGEQLINGKWIKYFEDNFINVH